MRFAVPVECIEGERQGQSENDREELLLIEGFAEVVRKLPDPAETDRGEDDT